ncbi:MAG: caspase family protein [Pseudomonadota bacterium]
MLRVVLITLVLCLSPVSLMAANRAALVIGNDLYDEVPDLQKAGNDARSVSAVLRDQGFTVTTVIDAPRREMNRQISSFTAGLQPGDTAVIFFAGHGVEIDGENYLLPTDIVAPDSGDREFVKSESIALSRLLDRVRATGARTTVAIIDACRENPFEATTGRSIGGTRGLGRIAAPEGTFVMFSAGAGQLALDRLSDADPDENSVFTRTLLPRLREPGLELRDLVAETRIAVRDLARTQSHAQFPAYYDELLGEFFFAGQGDPLSVPQPVIGDVRADFDLARSVGTAAALEAFVARYGGADEDLTVGIARGMLLEMAALPVQPAPEPEPEREPPSDPRAAMRETQEALNRLGCSAGGADGVAGPRTRAAFARFLAAQDSTSLGPDALGSPQALAALTAPGVKRCAVATPPTLPDVLSGTWRYRANCPLFIRTTGTIALNRSGNTVYRGPVSDSLGQRGEAVVTVSGRQVNGTTRWTNFTETWTGTLTADRKTFSATSSNGCTFTAALN